MKLKITAIVLAVGMMPNFCLGAADTLVRGEEMGLVKVPVKVRDAEDPELADIPSSGSESEGGYAGDHESDEEEGSIRSSRQSTPLPGHESKKSPRIRSFSKDRLKDKFKEVVGSFRSRKFSGESIPESDEEDSAYAESVGSRSPNRSLTPSKEEAEETLKILSELQASGLSADEQLAALKARLTKGKSQSAPPSSLRMYRASERRERGIDRVRNTKLWKSEIVRAKGDISE